LGKLVRIGDGVGGKTTISLPLFIFLVLLFLIRSQKFPFQSLEKYSVSIELEKDEFGIILKHRTEYCATAYV